MSSELTFKRLGHLGEIHLVEPGKGQTFCGEDSDGPNFHEVAPVDLEPRPSPQLCPDCKDIYDASQKEEEEPAEAE